MGISQFDWDVGVGIWIEIVLLWLCRTGEQQLLFANYDFRFIGKQDGKQHRGDLGVLGGNAKQAEQFDRFGLVQVDGSIVWNGDV